MKIFNEFGTPPDYLSDQYRVENNFGNPAPELAIVPSKAASGSTAAISPANLFPIASAVNAATAAAAAAAATQGSAKPSMAKSYYGGWKMYTLVPLAGILYYMRNKDEGSVMRIGKSLLASGVYAPYLLYVGGKYVYDKVKK